MLRSVFQPQFSTRAAHGRGLGLSSVQRLVRRNGGAISCRTGVGAGTTFTLYFKGSRGPQSG